ncbi:hypothetical protein N7532_001547 [Penicillium argentinense]|uniref:Zn(2)-C6 fungal-type domain-containing protein n=1 Tax=Penicillium argentinense TaxID=1131581 RepID=A0A9W9G2T6_9EURO|nr:uncharacterized protein N7532_001547 [Penicillium argentinense]KAJ5111012.1 hypothetical protein N7532_001547 [Penicillium argentinense]
MPGTGHSVKDAAQTPTDSPSSSSKPYSCVVCHKRKVKCDREEPCANCAKAEVECIYRPPPTPRRRKRERDRDDNASQSRGKSRRQSGDELAHVHDDECTSSPRVRGESVPSGKKPGSGKLIIKDGNSFFIDNVLWTSVSHELADATDMINDAPEAGGENVSDDGEDEATMLLCAGTKQSLSELHPNSLHIFKLWQTFLENVNPLTKILHAPTVQPKILEAMSDLPKASRELEALLFSIYCISLVSLQATEVEKSFGEGKRKLLSRCRRGAQNAFRNVSLLRTSNTMVLQAFMLYLLSMRGFSDPHTIWTLNGIALRIAQRIGIHRDGSGYGLSVFETEMRRRIWFQLIIIDATSAQFCGVATGPMLASADTRLPTNVNDSDLDPHMTEPVGEKEGATEMIFALARSEFGKWLRRWSKLSGESHSPWAFISSSAMSLRQKDDAIDEFESTVQEKFLRFCDPSIPLHLATIMMARSAVHYARLMAHHPRQYQDPNRRIPQEEKDIIFENCLKMAEYAHQAQTSPKVQRFIWHMVNHMPWDAMIFMLSEMRHRTDSDEKSKVWHIIGDIYARHLRQMTKTAHMPLHNALQTLIVKAWKAYIDDCTTHNRIPTSCPTIVATLLETANGSTEQPSNFEGSRVAEPSEQAPMELPSQGVSAEYFGAGAEDVSYLLEDSPNWDEWDNLLNQFQESLVDDMTLMPSS